MLFTEDSIHTAPSAPARLKLFACGGHPMGVGDNVDPSECNVVEFYGSLIVLQLEVETITRICIRL